MKRAGRILAAAGAVVLLAAGGAATWVAVGRARERALVQASLPAVPAVDRSRPAAAQLASRLEAVAARARTGDLAALQELATVCDANGHYTEARAIYEVLREIEPGEPRWPHRLATICAAFGELDQAIALWREVLAVVPDYQPARIRLGEALLKSDELDAAAVEFAAVPAGAPENEYAQHGLARIDAARGRWAEARRRLEPLVTRSRFQLGLDLLTEVCEQMGDLAAARALRSAGKAHGLYVGVPDPWIEELNDACYDPFRLALESGTAAVRGRRAPAERWLNRAIELTPRDGALRVQAALFYRQLGEPERAREHLQKGIEADPTFSDLWVQLVALADAMGDHAGAQRALGQGLAHNPDSGALLLERGRRLRAAGQLAAAEGDLRRAATLRHDDANPCVELALLCFGQERIAEGVEWLDRALVAEPDHPTALTSMVHVAAAQGNRAEADRWWARVQQQPRIEADSRRRVAEAYAKAFGAPPPR